MILASPAADLQRPFKLSLNTAVLQAMTRSQVTALPAAADQVVPRLVARTGLWPGEALAFQCTDLDFRGGDPPGRPRPLQGSG